jgi:hypothetical protein
MKKILFILLSFILLPLLISAAIYQTRESNGTVSFSDQPTQGSRLITPASLKALNTFSLPDIESSSPAPSALNIPSGMPTNIALKASVYTVMITSPSANTILQHSQAPYLVTASISPVLTGADAVRVVLFIYNGKVTDPTQLATTLPGVVNNEGRWQFSIPSLNTGEQLLVVSIVDKQSGKVLGMSSPVLVYYKLPSGPFHVGPVKDGPDMHAG